MKGGESVCQKGGHENIIRKYYKKRLPSILSHKSEQLIEILRQKTQAGVRLHITITWE